MNIRPKSKIVLDIVDAVHASTHDFIEEELTKFEEYLISHGATKTVAKAIMNEVRLLL